MNIHRYIALWQNMQAFLLCMHFGVLYLSQGINILTFSSYCQMVFPSGCTNLYTHQQCMKEPFA